MARLEQLLEQVKKDRDVRQNLIQIRQSISLEPLRRSFMYMLEGDFSLLYKLLEHEDPKVRKNAALILGMTDDEDVLPELFDAWEREETLFVREDYLKAISALDYREYLPRLRARIETLESEDMLRRSGGEENGLRHDTGLSGAQGEMGSDRADGLSRDERSGDGGQKGNPLWDNEKHLLSELSMLRSMVSRYEKRRKHHFIKMNPAPELILRTNVLHADVTAKMVKSGTVRVMRGSVHVKGGDLREILQIRTWMECLLTIPGARPVSGDEKMIAGRLRDLKIANYLNFLHEDNGDAWRYRIELLSPEYTGQKKGEFIRRIASRLDALERGKMINSDSDYEVELRLIGRKDGSFIPMLKLFTLPDERFSYRRETTAQSTSAHLAALAMELARPYLKDGAQVLDPFCAAGTLLVERCMVTGADPVYGTDRFAEAVEKAKINSANTSCVHHAPIHYINRDFFDFTHDYPFDEIIADLPGGAKEGPLAFMGRVLTKAVSLLKNEAVMVFLTDHVKELEQAVRETEGAFVETKFLINERTGFTEVILSFKR